MCLLPTQRSEYASYSVVLSTSSSFTAGKTIEKLFQISEQVLLVCRLHLALFQAYFCCVKFNDCDFFLIVVMKETDSAGTQAEHGGIPLFLWPDFYDVQ